MEKQTKTDVQSVEVTKTHQYADLFLIVEHEGEFMIALTNKILSPKRFKSLEDAQAYIDAKPWELIVNATIAVYETINKK